ncbi:hypothetical protein GE09DRAFT_118179 [Coniochaeta sp. 2T2.1]|nr:hypothetical protein GE09DRAFT_118179 [Coniochaeta sp. 2T2.1]
MCRLLSILTHLPPSILSISKPDSRSRLYMRTTTFESHEARRRFERPPVRVTARPWQGQLSMSRPCFPEAYGATGLSLFRRAYVACNRRLVMRPQPL